MKVNLPEVIGSGYKAFWNFKGRYRVIKGSRGSKKSCTTALWYIYNMMKYPLANLMVIRRYFYTHRDSTFTQLKWAVKRLEVAHLWTFKESKLEAIYNPTGQKILFRGMDDPLSITSITVDIGVLCWVWIEEAYQITDEKSFDKVDMSIRGTVPEGYYKQFTFTFNPWNKKHWLKKRFFDVQDSDILAITTTYECNEWLDEADIKVFEKMSEARFLVEGLGEWGISEGAIYKEFIENEKDFYTSYDKEHKCFYINGEVQQLDSINIGIDWGGNGSGHSFTATGITKKFDYVIILKSRWHSATGTTPEDVCRWIIEFIDEVIEEYGSIDDIFADSAEQLLINLLRQKVEYPVRNSLKRLIVDRIRFTVEIMAQRRLLLTDDCEPVVNFFKSAVYDEKSVADKRLDDGSYDVDSGDSWEYSIERFMGYIIRE